jgi:hypothetical protein
MAVREPVEYGTGRTHGMASSAREPSAWIMFAAIVLMIAGGMRIFDAIWAFQYNGVLPQNLENAVFGHSLTTYGWVYIIVAIVLIGSGLLLLSGSQAARWIGVVAAALGALAAMPWMPYYPVWSLVYVGIGALVVYALVAHGSRDEMG